MAIITQEDFAARMAALDGGSEQGHEEADGLMCEVLTQLGYSGGVEIFEAMDKWYGNGN
jgi:hypothetical protein